MFVCNLRASKLENITQHGVLDKEAKLASIVFYAKIIM